LFADTDLGRHMRRRPAGLDHQAGSLLPKLRGVLPTLARHTDNLPPPSGVNPSTYYEKRKLARRNNPQALDMDLAKQLWGRSEELLENFSR
jgi:hypothetical protein